MNDGSHKKIKSEYTREIAAEKLSNVLQLDKDVILASGFSGKALTDKFNQCRNAETEDARQRKKGLIFLGGLVASIGVANVHPGFLWGAVASWFAMSDCYNKQTAAKTISSIKEEITGKVLSRRGGNTLG